ncbi:hypothetical protein GCM10027440_01130 [Nocardiopsis coralliicola]
MLAVGTDPESGPPVADPAAAAERFAAVGRALAAAEPLLPLLLPLPAPAAADDPRTPALLETAVRRAGRRPRDITVRLHGTADLPAERLFRAVRHVRAAGFRCAIAADVPPQAILRARPFLVCFDPATVAAVPTEPSAAALVEGIGRITKEADGFPLADGVSTPEELTAVRAAGVRLATGALFADEDWQPGAPVRPVPEPAAERPHPEGGESITGYLRPPADLPVDATASEVLDVFTNDPALNSVVLIDHRERPAGVCDRARFLLAVTGPYGHALHASRPAERLAEPARTVPRDAPVWAALRVAGASGDRVHDDLVAVNAFGQVAGVVRVGDLIAALANG